MLKRFFAYYRPYRGLFFLDFFCAVAVGLMELGFPLIVNYFIDTLLPTGNWTVIAWTALALFVIYAISSVMQFIVSYWGHMLGINIETDMRKSCLIIFSVCPSNFSITTKQANSCHG